MLTMKWVKGTTTDRLEDPALFHRQVHQAGWAAFRIVQGQLGTSLATSTDEKLMAVLEPLAQVLEDLGRVEAREISLDRVAAGSIAECSLALKRGLGGAPLPTAVRAKLGTFYGLLVELQIGLPVEVPTRPEPEPAQRLIIPTGQLYQLRQMLFPAERAAIGAVRVSGKRAVLEALFDVTGVANEVHVEADPQKLGAAFIAMDAAGTWHRFDAHSHPGGGPEATHPSQEDRETLRRRVTEGDSRHMICAIFAGRYVRFFRLGVDFEPVAADGRIEIFGGGLKPVEGEESVYVFSS